jgi:pyruvate-ferredoxin/flavodoxin oxidoreductase
MELPLTIADWAASEARFARHFSAVNGSSGSERLVPFHEYLELAAEERAGKAPFVYTLGSEERLEKRIASQELVELAEERLALWSDLKEMAGVEVAPASAQREYQERESALRAEYEARLSGKRGAERAGLALERIAKGLLVEAPPPRAPRAS